jgi:heparosan-N-sulfate-glucuronate 5-epimerase
VAETSLTPAGTSRRSSAGFFSSASSFFLPVGSEIDADGVRGYPIDLRVKAESSAWESFVRAQTLFVVIAQYGLGCYERWLAGDGQEWFDAALGTGMYLVSRQQPSGEWLHLERFPHTFRLPPPWCSGLAQGEGASLLVRLHLQNGDPELAKAAMLAIEPLSTPQSAGGVGGELDGRPWPEEYPTNPQSHVLNGAMFALWGYRDVAVGLNDTAAANRFKEGLDSVVANIHRFDAGYWSYYSLYPHPILNPASSFYHALHVSQFSAMSQLAPRPELTEVGERWARYAASPLCRSRAFATKAAFRLLVPRNQVFARRLPWNRI